MSERPAILFLHGFTNTGASWGRVIAALGQPYRAIAPDLRGHGTASARRPVTLAAVLCDLDALAPPSPFILCGYSQGGRIALHAALRWADRLDRLVLIGASPGLDGRRERLARRAADERLAAEVERATIEAFARRWAATPVLAGIAPELAAEAHADRLRNTPFGLAEALRGLGTGALPSLWGRLEELTMPITVVAGERDRKFAGIARQMAARLPAATVAIVPGAGHAVHLERPDAVAALLG